jgi:hypothetical protein
MFKTYKDFRVAMTDGNICGAVQGIGLSLYHIGHVQRVLLDEMTLRQVQGSKSCP